MNSTIESTIYPGTAQRVSKLVARQRNDVRINIGIPMTGDERRPFLSSRAPEEHEKVRTDIRLRTVQDVSGATCLLYTITPVDRLLMRLPVGISSATSPNETARTVEGRSDKQYESFEGVIRTTDGAIITHAVAEDGSKDEISLTDNRVGKSFVEMVLMVAADRVPLR